MLASSPAQVTPRVRPSISCKTVIITFLFLANGLLILDILSKGSKGNQDPFIDNLLPALN
jgi:hypothetical protein